VTNPNPEVRSSWTAIHH